MTRRKSQDKNRYRELFRLCKNPRQTLISKILSNRQILLIFFSLGKRSSTFNQEIRDKQYTINCFFEIHRKDYPRKAKPHVTRHVEIKIMIPNYHRDVGFSHSNHGQHGRRGTIDKK